MYKYRVAHSLTVTTVEKTWEGHIEQERTDKHDGLVFDGVKDGDFIKADYERNSNYDGSKRINLDGANDTNLAVRYRQNPPGNAVLSQVAVRTWGAKSDVEEAGVVHIRFKVKNILFQTGLYTFRVAFSCNGYIIDYQNLKEIFLKIANKDDEYRLIGNVDVSKILMLPLGYARQRYFREYEIFFTQYVELLVKPISSIDFDLRLQVMPVRHQPDDVPFYDKKFDVSLIVNLYASVSTLVHGWVEEDEIGSSESSDTLGDDESYYVDAESRFELVRP